MSISSKVGAVLATGVGVAFLALTGCASQQSGAATPENLPSNCRVISKCKGMSSCKGTHTCKANSCKGKVGTEEKY